MSDKVEKVISLKLTVDDTGVEKSAAAAQKKANGAFKTSSKAEAAKAAREAERAAKEVARAKVKAEKDAAREIERLNKESVRKALKAQRDAAAQAERDVKAAAKAKAKAERDAAKEAERAVKDAERAKVKGEREAVRLTREKNRETAKTAREEAARHRAALGSGQPERIGEIVRRHLLRKMGRPASDMTGARAAPLITRALYNFTPRGGMLHSAMRMAHLAGNTVVANGGGGPPPIPGANPSLASTLSSAASSGAQQLLKFASTVATAIGPVGICAAAIAGMGIVVAAVTKTMIGMMDKLTKYNPVLSANQRVVERAQMMASVRQASMFEGLSDATAKLRLGMIDFFDKLNPLLRPFISLATNVVTAIGKLVSAINWVIDKIGGMEGPTTAAAATLPFPFNLLTAGGKAAPTGSASQAASQWDKVMLGALQNVGGLTEGMNGRGASGNTKTPRKGVLADYARNKAHDDMVRAKRGMTDAEWAKAHSLLPNLSLQSEGDQDARRNKLQFLAGAQAGGGGDKNLRAMAGALLGKPTSGPTTKPTTYPVTTSLTAPKAVDAAGKPEEEKKKAPAKPTIVPRPDLPKFEQNIHLTMQQKIMHETAVQQAINQIRDRLIDCAMTARDETRLLAGVLDAQTSIQLM